MKTKLVEKLAKKENSVAKLEVKIWNLARNENISNIDLSKDMLQGCVRYHRLTKDANVNKLLLALWLKENENEQEKNIEEIDGYDLFKVLFKSDNQFYSCFINQVSETLKVLSKPDESQLFHITDLLINGFNTRNRTLKNYLSTIAYFVLLKANNNEIFNWKQTVKIYLNDMVEKIDFENELKQLPLNTSVSKIEEKVTLILLDNILRNITSIN